MLIRADGSHAIGLGHVYRVKNLGQAMTRAGGNVVYASRRDSVANAILQSTGWVCATFDGDDALPCLKEMVAREKPDLVLHDMLNTTDESLEFLRQASVKTVSLDDAGAGLRLAQAVINAMCFHWGSYRPDQVKAKLFEGPQYMILSSTLNRYLKKEKTIPTHAKQVLMAFGGTDTHFLTERALDGVNLLNAELRVRINLGPGSRSSDRLIRTIRASKHQIELIRSAVDLFQEFWKADLVICAGGLTLYELAAMGVPSMAIAAEPHEIYNVEYWDRIGSTISLGWEKQLEAEAMSRKMAPLLDDFSRRAELSRAGRKIMDGQGTDRVIDIIEEVLN